MEMFVNSDLIYKILYKLLNHLFVFLFLIFTLFIKGFSQSSVKDHTNTLSNSSIFSNSLSPYTLSKIKEQIFPIQNLRRGLLLTGYTRLADNQLVEFQAKILSISQGKESYGKKIMVEVISDPFQELGIMQGMSGSPLYYENKIVGALAYTIDFLKKPIAYITPILDMMVMIDEYKESSKTGFVDFLNQENNIALTESLVKLPTINLHTANEFFQLMHAKTPLPLQTFSFNHSSQSSSTLNSDITSLASESENLEIHSGDSLAVAFVRGDAVIATTGTVTAVIDDYVLGLGHPLQHYGQVDLPLYTCEVEATVPRWNLSFKVSSLKKEIGSVVLDHGMGLLGKKNSYSSLIPLGIEMYTKKSLTLDDDYNVNTKLSAKLQKKLSYEVVKHPALFLEFTSLLLYNTLKNYRYLEKATILHYLIEIETEITNGYTSLKIFNANLNKTTETIKLLVDDLTIILDILYNNYLGVIPIKKMNIKLTTEPLQNVWLLKDVVLDKKYYRPGEELKVTVVYQLYQNPRNSTTIKKKYLFKLPENIQKGLQQISIGNALSLANFEADFFPDSYYSKREDILKYLQQDISTTTLAIWLPSVFTDYLQNKNDLEIYEDLTKYQKMLIFEQNSSTEYNFKTTMLQQRYPEDNIIIGNQILDFEVY